MFFFYSVEQCTIKKSKKKPLHLVWKNPDIMAEVFQNDFRIIFKNGDGKTAQVAMQLAMSVQVC